MMRTGRKWEVINEERKKDKERKEMRSLEKRRRRRGMGGD